MATPASLSELKNRKASPSCDKCGSDRVRVEAFAGWNRVTQQWVIVEVLDGNTVCAECGHPCEIKWRVEKAA